MLLILTVSAFALVWLPQTMSQTTQRLVTPASYMALFPSRFNLGHDYPVYVKLLRPLSYEKIEASLIFTNYTTNVTHVAASDVISLSQTKMEGTLHLQVKDDPNFRYRYMQLKLTGSGVVNFENTSSDIYSNWYSPKQEFVFIQTDKRSYKTGQKVRYRVFIVDRNMLPVDQHMNIYVQDPRGNRIQEHTNVSSSLGFSADLQLSEFPPLGFWSIRVTTGQKEDESLTFEVAEYVLPKFEVSLDLPPFGTVSNPELRGKVKAKYTYGKPVNGHVILTVTKRSSDWNWGFHPTAVQTQLEIDGEVDFSISTATLLKFDPDLKHDTLTVTVSVTERETEETQVTSRTVNFYVADVELSFMNGHGSADIFKPGFEYTTYFKITQPDGRPFPSSHERARATVTYFTDKPNQAYSLPPPRTAGSNLMKFIAPFSGGDIIFLQDMYLPIPRDGVAKLSLDIPDTVVTAHIEVRYKDKMAEMNVKKFRTKSKAYLNLDLKSAFVKIGQQAEFTIRSNIVPSQRVTYHVINDGRIIQTHYSHISGSYNVNTFYVTMTTEMAPRSHVLAYFYHEEENEIIADGLEFTVDTSKFSNEVRLRFDRSLVSPGENVTMHAEATPGSKIFMLAVDKSVILHASGNDVTKERVHSEMGIRSQTPWRYGQNFLSRKLSADDSLEIFREARFQLMTDSIVNNFDLSSLKGPALPTVRSAVWMNEGRTYDSMECIGPGCVNTVGRTSFASQSHMTHTERKDFPETWIWTNGTAGSNGVVDVAATVPDTITDWVATAFALSPKTGLGVVDTPTNLTVFLPFFVSLRLPFSIIADEIASIQAIVFNYYNYDMYVTVTLANSPSDFTGIVVDRYGEEEEEKGDLVKCILVKAKDVSSAYFTIKPVAMGTINLKVTASSSRGKDTVIRPLLVKAPGHQEERNTATLITVDGQGDFRTEIPISYPPRIVPNSHRIRISLIGDVFGPSLDHLHELIEIPAGCGEQTMVHFAPAVFAARYLNATGRLNGAVKEKVLLAMNTGYQRELLYQRYDGSFSAFGSADSNGSLWLTAFVLKTLAQASDFIYIDPSVVDKAAIFVLDLQNKDGTFNNTGMVYNKAMQGASISTNRSMMSYMLIALKEVLDRQKILPEATQARVQKAVLATWSRLHDDIAAMNDDYEMAIAAYSFALMSRGGSREVMLKLANSSNLVREENTHYWKDRVASHQVEIAAYALLTHALSGSVQEGLPVLRWLLKQRNSYGGFVSTQDTVMALQSLAEFASRTFSSNINMTVRVEAGLQARDELQLNPDNMDVLQFFEIKTPVYSVDVHAKGAGSALLEVSLFYNILEEFKKPSFELNVNANGTGANNFTLTACARYLDLEDSGMVLLDIGFPSGFSPLTDSRQIVSGQQPKREEVTRGRLVLYFEKMQNDVTCVKVNSRRESIVARVQPADVRVYSYYNPEKSAMTMYLPDSLKKTRMCDMCGIQCGCGYDPEVVPKERCARRFVYPGLPRNTVVTRQQPGVGNRAQASFPMNAMSWSRRTNTRFDPFRRGNVPMVMRHTSTVTRG